MQGHFGSCPRALCKGSHVLPFGQHTLPDLGAMHFYCPRCQDVYVPASRRLAHFDGCGFGPSFAHLLILNYKERLPKWPSVVACDRFEYIPRVFGFKVHDKNRARVHQVADDYY